MSFENSAEADEKPEKVEFEAVEAMVAEVLGEQEPVAEGDEEVQDEVEPAEAPVPEPVGVGTNGAEHAARPSVFKRFGIGKRRKPFLEEPGRCAICGNSLKVDSDDELDASGWQVSDDVGICPDCQTDGWNLPEGSPLPVRQRSERGL